MKDLKNIIAFFKEAALDANYSLKVGDRDLTLSKKEGFITVSDSDNELSFNDEQIPVTLRHLVESQPSSAVDNTKYPNLIKALDLKKSQGSIYEKEEGVFVTTDGKEFTLTPAFGRVWISKSDAGINTFYADTEPQFDALVQELLSSGFISDSSFPLHYRLISDKSNKASNFPDVNSQELVMDLIRDNASLNSISGFFTWGVETGDSVIGSIENTLHLLYNGKKVATPYISDGVLHFKILDEKDILNKVLPKFEGTNVKTTKLKVVDYLKMADSIQAKTMRLYVQGTSLDVFLKDSKKYILVSGTKAVCAGDRIKDNAEVQSALETHILSEHLDKEVLLQSLYKVIALEAQVGVFYHSLKGFVTGKEAYQVNSLLRNISWDLFRGYNEIHERVRLLEGNPNVYASPNTWESLTGVAQMSIDFPCDALPAITSMVSLEMLLCGSYLSLCDLTREGDPVTHKICQNLLENHQQSLRQFQDLTNIINS